MADAAFLSLGLDIGTTTSHLVVSRLTIGPGEDPFGRHHLLDKQVVYRGAIHRTPLLDAETIDADAIAAMVDSEYRVAGVTRADIRTGAVIVTGETALKRNAEAVVRRLAHESSTFAATVAGANQEAVLAGRGSGAAEWSKRHGVSVLNVDIGGGTTNLAWFDRGRLIEAASIRIGGRHLIRTTADDARYRVVTATGKHVLGRDEETADEALAHRFADLAARYCKAAMAGRFDAIPALLIITRPQHEPPRPNVVFYSGGVGALMARLDRGAPPSELLAAFDDVGPHLAAALMAITQRAGGCERRFPEDPIRATVIGAGQFSLSLSGETVWITASRLPLTDVRVVHPFREASDLSDAERIAEAIAQHRRLHDLHDGEPMAIRLPSLRSADWDRIEHLGRDLARACGAARLAEPWVVVLGDNFGRLLGATMQSAVPGRDLIVIDEVEAADADALDIGRPIEGARTVIPVVGKSLLFE